MSGLSATASLILISTTLIGSLRAYNVDEACYGSHQDDNLKPACPAGHVIYVSDVYTYAKKNSTGCRNESSSSDICCCQYVNDTEDCGMRYSGHASAFSHYVNCNGYSNCTVRVAWANTPQCCDLNVYLATSNYMRMHYLCIEESSIVAFNSAQGFGPKKELHIRNVGYPQQIQNCSVTTGYLAIIKSSSGPIVMEALDLRLAFNGTGHCAQKLHIVDGNQEKDITCYDNNTFKETTLYNSITSNITIRMDNTLSNDTGNLWIKVRANDTNATVSITINKAPAIYNCGDDLNVTLSGNTTTVLLQCSPGQRQIMSTSVCPLTTTDNPTSIPSKTQTTSYQLTVTTISTTSVITASSTNTPSLSSSISTTGNPTSIHSQTQTTSYQPTATTLSTTRTTTASSTTTPSLSSSFFSTSSKKDDTQVPTVVGAVLGTLALLGGAAAAVYSRLKRPRSPDSSDSESQKSSSDNENENKLSDITPIISLPPGYHGPGKSPCFDTKQIDPKRRNKMPNDSVKIKRKRLKNKYTGGLPDVE